MTSEQLAYEHDEALIVAARFFDLCFRCSPHWRHVATITQAWLWAEFLPFSDVDWTTSPRSDAETVPGPVFRRIVNRVAGWYSNTFTWRVSYSPQLLTILAHILRTRARWDFIATIFSYSCRANYLKTHIKSVNDRVSLVYIWEQYKTSKYCWYCWL